MKNQNKPTDKCPTRVDTTPQIRVISNVPVHFYSPVQVETIVPVEQRLSRSVGSNMTPHMSHNPMKSHHQSSDWV